MCFTTKYLKIFNIKLEESYVRHIIFTQTWCVKVIPITIYLFIIIKIVFFIKENVGKQSSSWFLNYCKLISF